MEMSAVFETLGLVIDAVGVAVIVVGGVLAAYVAARTLSAASGTAAYEALRRGVGRAILLGLEILVAADIIRTVAVEPTIDSLTVLGLLVLIRTFLSFSLEVELHGTLPWRRGSREASERIP